MKQLNVYEAKSRFSEIVNAAHRGETFVIAKAGTPLAKLVPLDAPSEQERHRRKIKFDLMKGEIRIREDFDAPLPPDVLEGFEG